MGRGGGGGGEWGHLAGLRDLVESVLACAGPLEHAARLSYRLLTREATGVAPLAVDRDDSVRCIHLGDHLSVASLQHSPRQRRRLLLLQLTQKLGLSLRLGLRIKLWRPGLRYQLIILAQRALQMCDNAVPPTTREWLQ